MNRPYSVQASARALGESEDENWTGPVMAAQSSFWTMSVAAAYHVSATVQVSSSKATQSQAVAAKPIARRSGTDRSGRTINSMECS